MEQAVQLDHVSLKTLGSDSALENERKYLKIKPNIRQTCLDTCEHAYHTERHILNMKKK